MTDHILLECPFCLARYSTRWEFRMHVAKCRNHPPTPLEPATEPHSQLPWTLKSGDEGDGDRWCIVQDATGAIVCDNEKFYPHAVDEANSAFIVLAVNSHADLVSALQAMVDYSDCHCDDHDSPDCCAATPDFHCPGCIAARALAKALR